jgi:gamma-glutamylcyclotransferase (GGCT)/AIG2-like uncharacterized protein YtfP
MQPLLKGKTMLVFVYGTLKSGYGNNRLLEGARKVCDALTDATYAMYNIGFPFIVPSEQEWTEDEKENAGKVVGEVWEIDSETHLAYLDRLESEGRFYNRVKTTVNNGLEVSLYEINPYAGKSYRGDSKLVKKSEEGTVLWGR